MHLPVYLQARLPLVVSDGVLAENGTMGLGTSDIVSIEVLRGAAAAAEYGARAGAVHLLLVRSIDNTGTELDSNASRLLGVNYCLFNERRKRAVVTTPGVLRNQTP